MCKYFLIIVVFLSSVTKAQDIVTVVASGSGANEADAINVALRSCIEKTYGVFISASTEIENDKLIKDEISTIGQGTISDYQVISSRLGGKDVTVSAKVSPSKVVDVIKAKGYDIELNGSVYAQNAMKEEFYKKEEPKVLEEFFSKYYDVNFFEFNFTINSPVNYRIGDTDLEVLNQKFLDKLKSHQTAIEERLQPNWRDFNVGKADIKYYMKTYGFNPLLPNLGGKNYNGNLQFHYDRSSLSFIPMPHKHYFPHNGITQKSREGNIQLIEILALASFNQNYIEFVTSFYNLLDQISIKDIEGYKKTSGNPFQIKFNGGIEVLNNLPAKNFNLRSGASLDFIEQFFNLIYKSSTALYITSGVFNIADEVYCELPSYNNGRRVYNNVLTTRTGDRGGSIEYENYLEVAPYYRRHPYRNNVSSQIRLMTFTGSRFLLFFSLENLNRVKDIELKPKKGIN